MRAASFSLGLGMWFMAFGCAGGNPSVAPGSTVGDPAAESREASLDASADGAAMLGAAGAADEQADSVPPVVDPEVAHALVAKTGEGEGATASALGLRFEVLEMGAELPWAFAVVNRGTEAALVDFDARLLTLEIVPPETTDLDAKGKPKKTKPPKPTLCRLPADVLPSSVDPALAVQLEPGEGLVQNFDPRLYCAGKQPWPLVAGAQVKAHFGWAPKMKVSWRAGKREEQPAIQSEPFVAEPSPTRGALPGVERADESGRRVKELHATPFALAADFGRLPGNTALDPAPPPGLELSISGSDASNEGSVTVSTTITNRGKRKQDLYFRRELVSYEVSGPDGVFHCDPEPDQRSPADRSAVQTLRPGGKLSAVSRLIEMCPAHAFARPGLYLVHARFDAADPATDLGFKAFMGRLVSSKPALVRVRHGELPFTPSAGMMRVHVGQ